MITHAEQGMVPALKALWKDSFGDNDGYIDFFFANRFRPDNTFVYLKNGSPVSLASVLDAELYCNSGYLPVGYIYGVATAIESRGDGYSTNVLEHIKSIYPTTFLVPSTESLFNFYEKRGYESAFVLNEFNIRLEELNAPVTAPIFENISAEEYQIIRDSNFQCEGYIRWCSEAITYALAENSYLGGSVLRIKAYDEKKINGILLYRSCHNQLFINETTLSMPVLRDSAYLLMKQTGVDVCRVRLASDSVSVGRSFGMMSGAASLKNGYCNLVLD
jgi:hypothetical protein